VLTDKYLKDIPNDSRAALGWTLKKDRLSAETIDKVARLNRIAVARGQSLAQLALQWVLRPQQHGQVTSALIGASRPGQIAENVRAVAGPAITADEIAAIEAILGGK
jgi:L-glyceraldehyde 3-phosphate reductase